MFRHNRHRRGFRLVWWLATFNGARQLRVLIQPQSSSPLAAPPLETVSIANPLHILKQIAAESAEFFRRFQIHKQAYIDSLKTMYELLNKARKDGLMALENDVEEPDKSPVFAKAPPFQEPSTSGTLSVTPCAWPSLASTLSIWIIPSTSISKFTIMTPSSPPPLSPA